MELFRESDLRQVAAIYPVLITNELIKQVLRRSCFVTLTRMILHLIFFYFQSSITFQSERIELQHGTKYIFTCMYKLNWFEASTN